MGFSGSGQMSNRLVINNNAIEPVHSFAYVGCAVSYIQSTDGEAKIQKFQRPIYTLTTITEKINKTWGEG